MSVQGAIPPTTSEPGRHPGVVRRAQAWVEAPDPIATLRAQLGSEPLEILWLFVSPSADFDALSLRAYAELQAKHVIACTTAGEIGEEGYEDDQIIALGLPQSNFRASAYAIADLDHFDAQSEIDRLIRNRAALDAAAPDLENRFAFLAIDGLSQREDILAGTLAAGLGSMPLFGGSAGDGVRFGQTRLSLDGRVMDCAAIVSLVAARGAVEVFSLNHLVPTQTKMVVTEADPARRIVRSINAEPAAQEYARIVGISPDALDQFTFAAHPVVVQLGGRHHVRAIQRVNEQGELVFFSAIDEGMVLTLAQSDDMAGHLDRALKALAVKATPDAILSCDCILRRLEAGQKQQMRDISALLAAHNAVGFGTYGEQFGALHVNHTMTGVAFYAPEAPDVTGSAVQAQARS